MEIKISYIVPIYNGEVYLRRCIDSFYEQGMAEDEFEVICVDDCSQDSSAAMLEQLARKHTNLRCIIHQQNRRTGTSLNEGMRIAKGMYVWIVGQDDWIEDDKAKHLIAIADKENLDVAPFNYNRVNSTGTSLISQSEVFKESDVMTGEELIRTYFYNTFADYLLGYEWRAIYRKQFLVEHGISFPEGVIFEDTTFLFKAIWTANRIKSVNDYIYNYRLNDKSITDYAQRYKGYYTYEFSFKTSAELLAFATEIDDEHVAAILCKTALKSMKSFAYKVVPMYAKEKKIFYANVAQEWDGIKDQVRLMPITHRLLVRPKMGYMLATMLKPVFLLKHIFVKRDYTNR